MKQIKNLTMKCTLKIFLSVVIISLAGCKKDDENGASANSGNTGNTGNTGNNANSSTHTCGEANVHNPNITYGSVNDINGNSYKTVVIGSQNWMAENLKTSTYRNGDAILTGLDTNDEWYETSDGAWCYYGNDPQNACPYGKLYNWMAVDDNRGICPTGWHVPSESEWIELVDHLGGEASALPALLSSDGGWFNGQEFTNSSGFSGVPGGFRGAGIFDFLGEGMMSQYWTSSVSDPYYAHTISIDGASGFENLLSLTENGCAIRCIQD